jgi:hypothetical protein
MLVASVALKLVKRMKGNKKEEEYENEIKKEKNLRKME